MQHWLGLGFSDVYFDEYNSLTVSNTQPACIDGNNGEPLFFNMARIAAASPPTSNLPFQACSLVHFQLFGLDAFSLQLLHDLVGAHFVGHVWRWGRNRGGCT